MAYGHGNVYAARLLFLIRVLFSILEGHLAIIHLLLFIHLLRANHDHELFLDYGYN